MVLKLAAFSVSDQAMLAQCMAVLLPICSCSWVAQQQLVDTQQVSTYSLYTCVQPVGVPPTCVRPMCAGVVSAHCPTTTSGTVTIVQCADSNRLLVYRVTLLACFLFYL